MIYYIYDASGNVIGLKYNNDIYYYEKNIQDDVTGIMDDSFNLLAKYEYDSWGNIKSVKDTSGNTITNNTNIALINPFRYRSYYYDTEIGMYYLNSRYYNQEWGRFINADQFLNGNKDILGYNLYAYVSNDIINFSDPIGKFKISDIWNVTKTIYNILKKPATKSASKATSKIAKDIVKTELKKAFTIEHSTGSGYGFGANFGDVSIEAKDITLESITTIKPFPTWKETYSSASEGSIIVAGTGFTKVTDFQGISSWQFHVGNVDISNKTIFIGVGIEAYFKVGGSFKAGFDFDETNLFYHGYKAILRK